MHALEMREDDVAIERVAVLISSVRDDGVRNRLLVVATEISSASRALLLVDHEPTVMADRIRLRYNSTS